MYCTMILQPTIHYALRAVSLFLSGLATAAPAQTCWTVDSCIHYAIERNLALQNLRLDIRIAHENQTEAIGSLLPSVSTSGTVGKRMGRSVDPKTNQYTTSSFLESTMGIDISLPLFDGFQRINRIQFARLNKQLSNVTTQAEENRMAFEVVDAYYMYIFDRKMHALATEQRKLGERYHRQMLAYVELGLRSPADLQEVEARLQSDIYQETVKKKTEALSLLALKALLQLSASDTLLIACCDTDATEPPLSTDYAATAVYAESETALPEFRMMALRERTALKSLALATGALAPSIRADFSLYSSYYDTERRADGKTVPFGRQLKNNWNKYLGLRVSLPIFSGLSRLTAIRKERFRLQQVRNENARQRIALQKEIADACLSLQASAAEWRQAALQLKALSATLKTNEEKWAEGMVSVFELMEQRNRYISAKTELTRTRLQYDLKHRMVTFYRTGSFLHPATE